MSLERARSHLQRVPSCVSDFDRFDLAWLAFTQLYQLERRPGEGNRDSDLIHRAGDRLHGHIARLVNQITLHPLAALEPPIYDEKILETRPGVKDFTCHNVLKRVARELASRAATLEDLHAVLDLLYVIRCNLFKGYKLRDASRDQEVLAAAAPPLLAIALELHHVHEQAIERRA